MKAAAVWELELLLALATMITRTSSAMLIQKKTLTRDDEARADATLPVLRLGFTREA